MYMVWLDYKGYKKNWNDDQMGLLITSGFDTLEEIIVTIVCQAVVVREITSWKK